MNEKQTAMYECGVYETVLLVNGKVIDLGHNCITHTTKYIRNNDLIDKAIVIVNGVKIKCSDIKKFNNFGIVNEYHRNRKVYTFELDTEDSDKITLKDDNLDKETTLINKRDNLIFELATVACELDNIEVDFSDMEQSQMFIDVMDYVADYLEEIAKEQK